MLYYLFDYLEREFSLIGASVFQYISFRAGCAALLSLLLTLVLGPYVIAYLRRAQYMDKVRPLGLPNEANKAKTPTMGGVLLLCGVLFPALLFAKLENVYVLLLLATMLWMGAIGFVDDYIKVRMQKKEGLRAKFKLFGQVLLGILVAGVLFFQEDIVIRDFAADGTYTDVHALRTTIPFIKNNELDYTQVFAFLGEGYWLGYVLVVVFVVVAVSNGANITDGLDGLASGTSAIVGLTLAIFAYLSGNVIFSDYLNIMYIPDLGELVVFCAAFVGACIGFLWYNSYPAQVFMGDTGSLSMGGVLAVLALIVRKELLLPLLCGIFFVESLSIILQVGYFKYTRQRYGVGRRIFLMSPLHHHYQKQGQHEVKIVIRFWTVGILLAILTLVTLKLR